MNSITPSTGSYVPNFEIPLKGMARANRDAVDAAVRVADGEVAPEPFVKMMGAQYNFQANAKVLNTMDEMLGTLLDTVA